MDLNDESLYHRYTVVQVFDTHLACVMTRKLLLSCAHDIGWHLKALLTKVSIVLVMIAA